MASHGLVFGTLVVLGVSTASADVVQLDNGTSGVGQIQIGVDDFGSFGREFAPMATDRFWPPGVTREESQTFISLQYLFITQPIQGAVTLSTHQLAYNKVEPPNNGDGVKGPATLTRTVTTPITKTGAIATSRFRIADSASGVAIDVDLEQQVVAPGSPATTTRLDQTYTIRNAGVAANLVFHTYWDQDIYFSDNLVDDVVGAGQGLCYVYQHDPGNPVHGGALSDGGSSSKAWYYAAKVGGDPPGGPAFTTADSTTQPVWEMLGMPMSWRNYVSNLGYNVDGATLQAGDSMLGLEWSFALAAGATHTIKVRRHYGTNAMPCNVSATCGNGSVEMANGETCDVPSDSATCNAGTCTAPMCGDGYINAAANETCESAGVDSIDCNGATCTTPACGDGYVNAAAGEACEDGELCDPATCTFDYSVGGGCAGCSSGADPSWLVILLVAAGMRRRAPPRGSRRSAR